MRSNASNTIQSLSKDRKSIDIVKKPNALSSLVFKPLDGSALATKAQTHHSISPQNHFYDSFNYNNNSTNQKLA